MVIETSDGPVTVVVLGYDRGKVKLGFEAPDCVTILREELYESCENIKGRLR